MLSKDKKVAVIAPSIQNFPGTIPSASVLMYVTGDPHKPALRCSQQEIFIEHLLFPVPEVRMENGKTQRRFSKPGLVGERDSFRTAGQVLG